MAGKIQLLTDEVIGKIAAGEVVERPCAAVKELVENSLDAGSTSVTVEVKYDDEGISYFRVTDNGSGIRQDDIRMAFERHATSKITKAQDLFSIHTLGFRGEALASIAAVAHVTCTTRTKDDQTGIKVQNDGGRITSITETACPEGTTFVVRDLFFNTPVRRKFLKKPSTEAALVSDLIMRMILSRPDVSFRYISQGKTVYHSAGDGQLKSAVFSIYGREMIQTMREVDGNGAGMVVKGFVGIGESGRGNRNHQSFYINGRYMKSQVLSSAIENACRERVMIGKFPVCILHLTMPYESVDVNVHPNKLEVRFQNEHVVAETLETIVRESIMDKNAFERPVEIALEDKKELPLPPVVKTLEINRNEESRDNVLPFEEKKPEANAVSSIDSMEISPKAVTSPEPVSAAPEGKLPEEPVIPAETVSQAAPVINSERAPVHADAVQFAMKNMAVSPTSTASVQVLPKETDFLPQMDKPVRYIGVAFDTFILVEYDDNLLLIDQHAVHERLLFDRLMAANDDKLPSQELLVPYIMAASPSEMDLLAENQDVLEHIGLTIEPFSQTEISVRTVPLILGEPQPAEFVRDIISQLESDRGKVTLEKRRSDILQTACKHAIKGGDRLSDSEIRYLVTEMIDKKVTPTCPHGRPLVVCLRHSELDKKFKRIQN